MINKIILKSILIVIIFLCNSCVENPEKDLGKGYRLGYNSRDDLGLVGPRCNIAEGPLKKIEYNLEYIVLITKPRMKIYDMYNLKKYDYYKSEIKFKQINYFEYWIVDKRVDSIYGPFQKLEYLEKMKELNIPDSLRVDK